MESMGERVQLDQGDSSPSPLASQYHSPISSISSTSTHDIATAACHTLNFHKVVEALKSAADRATSAPGISRYTSVHVLLLQWELDDLGVDGEVKQLSDVFTKRYRFYVEQWKIPSSKPILRLTMKISSWVDEFDGQNNLFILYYAGHGKIDDGRQVLWRNVRDSTHEGFAEIKWAACEDILHEAASGTLFLLDCCYSAGSVSRPLRGFSETIAASGFESIAPPPGPHSFTATLIKVLRRWAETSPAFSVANLHTEILVSLKEVGPQHIREGISFEWRRTPVHYIRSSDICPPSIVLSPFAAASLRSVPSGGFFTLRGTSEEGSASQPRVILKITLAQDHLETDSSDACHRWLAPFPLPTTDIKVEAVYRSFSTVVLVSMSVAAWDLLPEMPGCSFVCFATSENLVIRHSPIHIMDTLGIGASPQQWETSQVPKQAWGQPRVLIPDLNEGLLYPGSTTHNAKRSNLSSWPSPTAEQLSRLPSFRATGAGVVPDLRPRFAQHQLEHRQQQDDSFLAKRNDDLRFKPIGAMADSYQSTTMAKPRRRRHQNSKSATQDPESISARRETWTLNTLPPPETNRQPLPPAAQDAMSAMLDSIREEGSKLGIHDESIMRDILDQISPKVIEMARKKMRTRGKAMLSSSVNRAPPKLKAGALRVPRMLEEDSTSDSYP